MTHQLSDAQIDQRAQRYAMQHQVSYAEALGQVVTMNFDSHSAAGNARSQVQEPVFTQAQLDQMAQRLAQEKGLDYFNALQMVSNQVGAKAQPSAAPDADQKMHASALNYARANQVSYAEALERVAASFSCSNFSEPGSASGDAVQQLEGQDIEIFRAGVHIDDAGNTRVFSVADVKAMAANYNPNALAAVLTIGHPADNLPDYGRVQSLSATADGLLTMRVRNVAPQLANAIKQGFFKKRSASFLPPNSGGNPAPGQWYLRHVGWLGAQAPALKGLADAKFVEANEMQCVFVI